MTAYMFLGAFAKFRKATSSFVMSGFLSVDSSVHSFAWNNSAPSGRNFMKVCYMSILRKSVENIQVSLKFNKNTEHLTLLPIYINFLVALNFS